MIRFFYIFCFIFGLYVLPHIVENMISNYNSQKGHLEPGEEPIVKVVDE
jgi:hypothetical protein